jgi:hypothetical protein
MGVSSAWLEAAAAAPTGECSAMRIRLAAVATSLSIESQRWVATLSFSRHDLISSGVPDLPTRTKSQSTCLPKIQGKKPTVFKPEKSTTVSSIRGSGHHDAWVNASKTPMGAECASFKAYRFVS